MRFSQLWSSSELITDTAPTHKNYIRIFGDKPRPTPQHVCNPDGLWVLPPDSKETVAENRRSRYVSETDGLLIDIAASRELGQDVSEKIQEWVEKVGKIKADLPFPEPSVGYYQPVK